MLATAESEKNSSEVSTPKSLISPSHNRSKSAGEINSPSKLIPPRAENVFGKSKKSSKLWNWKNMPLLALNHIRNRKFNCCFYLHVHSIEGLPSNFNNLDLRVHWKRKHETTTTRPSRVCHETATFEETLMHQCSIYGHNRSNPDHSIKYKSKIFMIYPCFVGFSDLDIGKYWIDLTKILPRNLNEQDEKKSFEKWSMSFKLTGMAMGATLNVSFGYSIMVNTSTNEEDNSNFCSNLYLCKSISKENDGKFQHIESVPISRSINLIYQKLDEAKICKSTENPGVQSGYIDFRIIDQELLSPTKKIRLEESSCRSFNGFPKKNDEEESLMDMKSNYKATKMTLKSLSLDDVAESVANDFLNMIALDHNNPIRFSIESYPESPRERLLRQFEKENLIFNTDEDVDEVEFGRVTFSESQIWDFPENLEFSRKIRNTEEEKSISPSSISKRKAKKIENFENEDPSSGAFGSIIALPFKDLSELPPLDDDDLRSKNEG